MINKEILKKYLPLLGKLLGILGLIFIFYTLYEQYTWQSFADKFSSIIPLLPLLFILNIFSILLGIYAWHFMLLHYATAPFAFLNSFYYFCKTEIAKYLPGNVFHFIGRQALASKIGISQLQMGKISLLFALLLLAATVFSSTIFALFAQTLELSILGLMILASIVTLVAILMSYKSFPIATKIQMNLLLIFSVSLQGVMLASIVLYQQNHFDMTLFLECSSIYVLSWLIGFVTPGASGGLGVREGSFVAIVHFLHLNVASEVIIFSVLLVRLINILSDIILFLATFGVESKVNTTQSS